MHNDWANGGLAFKHGEAGFADARANGRHIGSQLGNALRLAPHDFNGAVGATRDGGWKGV